MVERIRYEAPSVFTERSANVSYDDGTVGFMSQLSGAFLDVANKAHQNELKKNIEMAQRDGALHGIDQGGGFKPAKGRGIVHKAYNDSGVQAATVKMSSRSQQAIQRIAMENPGNPAAQAASMEKWADAFASELPDEMICLLYTSPSPRDA